MASAFKIILGIIATVGMIKVFNGTQALGELIVSLYMSAIWWGVLFFGIGKWLGYAIILGLAFAFLGRIVAL